VSQVLVDGVSVINQVRGNVYVLSNVTAAHTVEIYFDEAARGYYITASSDSGTDISPAGTVVVSYDSSKTYTFVPKPGKVISSVEIDGQVRADLAGTTKFTFYGVMSNHTIHVTTADKVITLTVDIVGGDGRAEYRVGKGSTSTYSGTVAVPFGSEITLNAVPGKDYVFERWLNNGYAAGTEETLTVSDIQESVDLTIVLEPKEEEPFNVWWIILAVLAVIAVLVLCVGIIRYVRAGKAGSA
jgi:hypothetical protein